MSNTKRSSSGCFSSVLRLILCSRTPQTQLSDSNYIVDDVAKVQVRAPETGPGIVARLMGLDSLPDNNNWLHKSTIPGPVTRSRSVNFMDYMMEFDLTQAKHRRIITSSSLREQPQGPQLFQVQRNQNQEFLVVYLDKNNDAAGFKARKSGKGDGSGSISNHGKQKDINVREKVECNKKQIREKHKKISKLKNEPRGSRVSGKHSFKAGSCVNGVNSKALRVVNRKEASVVTRKKKNQSRSVKKVEFSENNFSVLRVNGISEDSRSLKVKSKNKCSSKSVKHDSSTTDIISARISMPEGLEKQDFTKNNSESTDMEETEYYIKLVSKLINLTEKDLKFSNWETKKAFTFEPFEEICAEFGDQILDFMLQQVADELCRISHANY